MTLGKVHGKILILYVKGYIQQQFPQDTISVGVMFNKSSLNKFTDFIQSIYNMMTGADLTTLGLGFLVYTSYVELVNDFISEYNPIVEEIIQRRDELWSEYIVQPNDATLLDIEAALNGSVENKARAIVLGHSQGGMYTYNAFNSFSDSVRTHFYSLNVGVPTANNPNWYLINDNDWIVNAARLLLDGIPAGESNGPVSGDECECLVCVVMQKSMRRLKMLLGLFRIGKRKRKMQCISWCGIMELRKRLSKLPRRMALL